MTDSATNERAEDLGPGPLRVAPMSDALGLEVRGLDLALPLDAGITVQLGSSLDEYGALLFRGQRIDEAQQSRATAMFGELARFGTGDERPDHVYVGEPTLPGKRSSLARGPMDLHFDGCFNTRPYRATTLYCMEAPETGGHTLLADAGRAFADLPDRLAGSITRRYALQAYLVPDLVRPAMIDPRAKMAVQPVVIQHPRTRTPVLYVNRLMTMRILDVEADESERLLAELIAHAEQPRFLHSHRWEPGDLLVLDNRRIAHGRTSYADHERRLLRRQATLGVPVEAAFP